MPTFTMSPGRTLLVCLAFVAPVAAFGQDCPPLPCESPTMDGYTYDVVQIGEQCWFAENLRTTVYADGVTPVPNVVDSATWIATNSPASVVFGEGGSECANSNPLFDACNEAAALEAYGRLYNAHAALDPAGLCPSGWHVPSEEEWLTLKAHVATVVPADEDGTALKTETGWWNDGNGTDLFGFA
ncbi:MAG: FISUMP domain-containing protein, partial [Flavobacteriales bacterium]